MGLCGSFKCGCGITSTTSTASAIDSYVPTIDVTGSGESGDPYDLAIDTDWADAVAARLLGSHEYLSYAPGGNVDATTSGTMTTWVTLGNLTVPSWATTVVLSAAANGFYDVTAAQNIYNMRYRVNAVNGPTIEIRGLGINARMSVCYIAEYTPGGTGSVSVDVQMARTSGTGALRAGTSSDFQVVAHYL
jgi:hypothetical protein